MKLFHWEIDQYQKMGRRLGSATAKIMEAPEGVGINLLGAILHAHLGPPRENTTTVPETTASKGFVTDPAPACAVP
jgi:hypothetical protein